MAELEQKLKAISHGKDKKLATDAIRAALIECGYEIVDEDTIKPWDAYFRLSPEDADTFIEEFFPGLNPVEARSGVKDAELAPKILFVLPGQRLSWQYLCRLSEHWRFLTPGAYHRSPANDEGLIIHAPLGKAVQFDEKERHRLVGLPDNPTLVAEI